jgi:hypothetical protein
MGKTAKTKRAASRLATEKANKFWIELNDGLLYKRQQNSDDPAYAEEYDCSWDYGDDVPVTAEDKARAFADYVRSLHDSHSEVLQKIRALVRHSIGDDRDGREGWLVEFFQDPHLSRPVICSMLNYSDKSDLTKKADAPAARCCRCRQLR